MPFVDAWGAFPCFKISKRLGLPNMCGWAIPGWSQCGDDQAWSGVYQQRRNRKWNGIGGFISEQHPRNFLMCPAWPSQPPSEARDAQQDKFKTALQMWQALTADEKLSYHRIANRKSRRGYDYFMSLTLKSL